MDYFTAVLILHVYDSFTNNGTTERLLALLQSNDKNCQKKHSIASSKVDLRNVWKKVLLGRNEIEVTKASF